MRNTIQLVSLPLLMTLGGCAGFDRIIGPDPNRTQREVPYSRVYVIVVPASGLDGRYKSHLPERVLPVVEQEAKSRGFQVLDREVEVHILDELDRCANSGLYDECVKVGEMLGAEAILRVVVTEARMVESARTRGIGVIRERILGNSDEIGMQWEARVRMSGRLISIQEGKTVWPGNAEGFAIVFSSDDIGNAPENCARNLMRRFPRSSASERASGVTGPETTSG